VFRGPRGHTPINLFAIAHFNSELNSALAEEERFDLFRARPALGTHPGTSLMLCYRSLVRAGLASLHWMSSKAGKDGRKGNILAIGVASKRFENPYRYKPITLSTKTPGFRGPMSGQRTLCCQPPIPFGGQVQPDVLEAT
jgi:hypothetical protein